MTIQVAPRGGFDAQSSLEIAIYDNALAGAAQPSLSQEGAAAACRCRAGAESATATGWLSQSVLLRFYRRALVGAIRHGLTIVLAPCSCVNGLNTYHALPGIGCLRELARQQARDQGCHG